MPRPFAPQSKVSLESAVTSTAAKLATMLDGAQAPGQALYRIVSSTDTWFTQGVSDTVFTALASTDVCTAASHGLATGWAVQVSNAGGALPTGLSASTSYWAIVLGVDTFKLATSRANAIAGTAIDITTNGTGTQTMTAVAAAGAGATLLPAGVPAYLDGVNGPQCSVIRDTADGRASITAVAGAGLGVIGVPNAPFDAFRAEFAAWLPSAVGTDSQITGLLYNFIYPSSPSTAKFVYPRLSGELIFWHLSNGEVTAASAVATKLITWQSTASGTTAEQRRKGGWPSVVAQDPMNPGSWIAAGAADGSGTPRWYTHDALVILTALTELYARNPQSAFLTAATAAGDFVKNMISLPVAAGYDIVGAGVNAPVNFVDAAGSWDLDIYGSVSYCYIGGMDQLTALTSNSSYSTLATNARAFYANGQHAQGWWYDHYTTFYNTPTFPVGAYDPTQWKKFSDADNQILADNVMHAALGAAKAGDTAAVTATRVWLLPAISSSGGVPGYLAPGASGADGFNGGSVYFDIVSSAEWRSLEQWDNQRANAQQAVKFVEACQDVDGGFLWGRYRDEGDDATVGGGGPSAQAPHTGMWATADLSQFGTSLVPAIAYDSNLFPARRLAAVAVSPHGLTIGSPQQFTVLATYSDSTTADITSHAWWFSDDTGKMTVNQTGLGTKVGAGAFNMYATVGRISDHAFNVVS